MRIKIDIEEKKDLRLKFNYFLYFFLSAIIATIPKIEIMITPL